MKIKCSKCGLVEVNLTRDQLIEESWGLYDEPLCPKCKPKPHCIVENCKVEQFDSNLCLFHYVLWEEWGYEHGGFDVYTKKGSKEGRKQFAEWLSELKHLKIVEVLSKFDYKLDQAVRQAIMEIKWAD